MFWSYVECKSRPGDHQVSFRSMPGWCTQTFSIRVGISLAQWSLSSSFHLDELCLESSAQFQKTLARWRERWQVPRYVYLAERDNRLLLDLEQFNQAEELRYTLQARKNTQTVILPEALPGPEHAWLEGPGGHYLSEYIVSLINRPSMTPA